MFSSGRLLDIVLTTILFKKLLVHLGQDVFKIILFKTFFKKSLRNFVLEIFKTFSRLPQKIMKLVSTWFSHENVFKSRLEKIIKLVNFTSLIKPFSRRLGKIIKMISFSSWKSNIFKMPWKYIPDILHLHGKVLQVLNSKIFSERLKKYFSWNKQF